MKKLEKKKYFISVTCTSSRKLEKGEPMRPKEARRRMFGGEKSHNQTNGTEKSTKSEVPSRKMMKI